MKEDLHVDQLNGLRLDITINNNSFDLSFSGVNLFRIVRLKDEWKMKRKKSAPLSSILHKFPSQITFNQLLMSESRNDNDGRTRSESSDDT